MAGGEPQAEHGPDVSLQRAVQDAFLQTQDRLVDEAGNQPVLHVRVRRPADAGKETCSRQQDADSSDQITCCSFWHSDCTSDPGPQTGREAETMK